MGLVWAAIATQVSPRHVLNNKITHLSQTFVVGYMNYFLLFNSIKGHLS